MEAIIPSSSEVRAQLERLDNVQLQRLAEASKVPFTTLWKIRAGKPGGTDNPGLDTVRKFLPHVETIFADGARNQRAEPAAEVR